MIKTIGLSGRSLLDDLTIAVIASRPLTLPSLIVCKDRPLNPMVLIIDETKKQAIISSKNYAEGKGQKPLALP